MLSTTADHALRAVLHLSRVPAGTLVSAEEIAQATGSPRRYLAKTLNALVRAGVVASARGPLGGFALAVPASLLTVARVIEPFNEPQDDRRQPLRCMLGSQPCSSTHPCEVHARWMALLEARRQPLEKSTIAWLMGQEDVAPAGPCGNPWLTGAESPG